MDVRDSKRKMMLTIRLTTLFVVAFFLSLVIGEFSGVDKVFAAKPEGIEVEGEIKADNTSYDIKIKKGKEVYYSIKPEYSAYYYIQVQNNRVYNMYVTLYDSDMKKIGLTGNSGTKQNVLEKDTKYYIGFQNASQTEEIVENQVKIYVSLWYYKPAFSSKLFVKDGKVTENDLDPNLYYTLEGVKYKANCTIQYRKFSSYSPAGDYIDGIPSECGKYRIYYTPIAPFVNSSDSVLKYYDLSIYDLTDFSNYDISINIPEGYGREDTFYYLGKEIDISQIEISRNSEKMELGKDYKYDGFCSDTAYYGSSAKNFMWKTDKPKEPGAYYLKFTGIGECKGEIYKYIQIKKAIDFDFVSITDIKTDNMENELSLRVTKVFKIQPAKSGKYTINLSSEVGDIVASLYDKKEALIKLMQEKRDDMKNLSFEIDLKEGEIYYLCISDDTDYGSDKPYKISINIPDYTVYVPAEKNEDKKTEDNKSENQKVEEKKTEQKNTVQKTSEKKTDSQNSSVATPLAKGKTFKLSGMTYKVISTKKGNYQVGLIKIGNKSAKKVTVKDSVKYKGVTYKITSIGSSAFKNIKKVETITLGKNISKIGKPAFKGCAKLKKIKVPKNKLSKYKKLLKKAGLSGDVKVSYK